MGLNDFAEIEIETMDLQLGKVLTFLKNTEEDINRNVYDTRKYIFALFYVMFLYLDKVAVT